MLFRSHAVRLEPDTDLRQALLAYCADQELEAAYILSCVGSLKRAVIRFADRNEGKVLEHKLEILTLSGTLSCHGCHLHICVANAKGKVSGGHLLDGSLVYTTAEIVLGEVPDMVFKREKDAKTGWLELDITLKPWFALVALPNS